MPIPPLYFVQITDTHLGRRANLRRTARVVDGINRLSVPVACVVHTGDVMDDNVCDERRVREGLRVFERLSVPVHFVAGNHDVPAAGLPAVRACYERHFGALDGQATYEGVVFLFCYTEPLAQGDPAAAAAVLDRLEERLRAAGGRPVLLFHHTPATRTGYHDRAPGGWPAGIAQRWATLLNAYDVKAVMAGHYSDEQLHWLGDVPVFVAPAVKSFRGRTAAFRVYEYRDGRVGYSTCYADPRKSLAQRVRARLRKYLGRTRPVPVRSALEPA